MSVEVSEAKSWTDDLPVCFYTGIKITVTNSSYANPIQTSLTLIRCGPIKKSDI